MGEGICNRPHSSTDPSRRTSKPWQTDGSSTRQEFDSKRAKTMQFPRLKNSHATAGTNSRPAPICWGRKLGTNSLIFVSRALPPSPYQCPLSLTQGDVPPICLGKCHRLVRSHGRLQKLCYWSRSSLILGVCAYMKGTGCSGKKRKKVMQKQEFRGSACQLSYLLTGICV